MASKLSFLPITDLSISIKFIPKPSQRIPNLPLQLLYSSSGHRFFCPIASSFTRKVAPSSLSSPASISDTQTNPLASSSSKLVLVVGGSGGVGQLVVASLLSRNVKVRLVLRDPEKATSLFGEPEEKLQVVKGDTRNPLDLDPSVFEGITHVICCTGTTAFPSRRWDGDNTPEKVDWEGVRNLVSALPPSVKRIVLVSSIGVTKFNEFPWRWGYSSFVI